MAFNALADEYGYVLLVCVLIAFEIIVIGFLIPSFARKKTFTEEWMKENFGQEHREALNDDIKGQGYPDMGNGIYSQKLSYKQWYEFNSAQRAHYNYVEWIASTLALILIAGVYFPVPSAALGLGVFLGRLIYAIGYAIGGPQGRLIGVLINDLAFLGTFVLAFISSIYFILGK